MKSLPRSKLKTNQSFTISPTCPQIISEVQIVSSICPIFLVGWNASYGKSSYIRTIWSSGLDKHIYLSIFQKSSLTFCFDAVQLGSLELWSLWGEPMMNFTYSQSEEVKSIITFSDEAYEEFFYLCYNSLCLQFFTFEQFLGSVYLDLLSSLSLSVSYLMFVYLIVLVKNAGKENFPFLLGWDQIQGVSSLTSLMRVFSGSSLLTPFPNFATSSPNSYMLVP